MIEKYLSKSISDKSIKIIDTDIKYNHDFATFSTTDIPDVLKSYLLNFLPMNIAVSQEHYKSIPTMTKYCLDFIGQLFHADMKSNRYTGIATVGSSEACIMAGVMMLTKWKINNRNSLQHPNIIISEAYQVCWKKFADMFSVRLNVVPTVGDSCVLDTDKLASKIDSGTIGVVGILGNTFTGRYDDIPEINKIVEEYNSKHKQNIIIHIDAASGGFYDPFINPDRIFFDFRLKNIYSINVSGHKYGLCPPSIGWLFCRSELSSLNILENDLDYLGGQILSDKTINFSKSAIPLAAQYFLISNLGFNGYGNIMQNLNRSFQSFVRDLKEISSIRIVSCGDIPMIVYTSNDVDLRKLEDLLLKKYGFYVPTYRLPGSNILCQRIVIRSDFTDTLQKEYLYALNDCINILKE
ncbi:aminotransferase class V-fold PLP-dependent enzyme [Methanocorpusculum sp.]|nr:aminotransferase class V-fold PLP-dependent enzyme [Methanocorpusculum sp.]